MPHSYAWTTSDKLRKASDRWYARHLWLGGKYPPSQIWALACAVCRRADWDSYMIRPWPTGRRDFR
jgi:hypothetical protein